MLQIELMKRIRNGGSEDFGNFARYNAYVTDNTIDEFHAISLSWRHAPVKCWPPAAPALRCPKEHSRTSSMQSCATSQNTVLSALPLTSFPQTRGNRSPPIPLS